MLTLHKHKEAGVVYIVAGSVQAIVEEKGGTTVHLTGGASLLVKEMCDEVINAYKRALDPKPENRTRGN